MVTDAIITKKKLYTISPCSNNVCDNTEQVQCTMYKQVAAAQYHLNNDLQ